MKTFLIILQVAAAAVGAWPHRKPLPRPVVIVTDTAAGDVHISVTCPAPFVLTYTVTVAPETIAERVNAANTAVCAKAPKVKK